jgi:flagellar motor switch protein FliN/FliY
MDVARSKAQRSDRAAIPDTDPGLDVLMDVPLEITVELGRARRLLEEVLALAAGSVIQLDRLAGEAVDVLVNGELVARGEVLVIDESFGVRITELVQRKDRARPPGRRS